MSNRLVGQVQHVQLAAAKQYRSLPQLTRAFRDLSDIASPELEAEIRRGAPQTSPISTAMVGEARADEALLPGMGRLPAG